MEVSEAALEVARVAAQVATTTEMHEPPPGEWHGDERFLRFEISSEETKGLLKICKHSLDTFIETYITYIITCHVAGVLSVQINCKWSS